MKKIFTCLSTYGRACSRPAILMQASFRSCILAALAALGLTTACGQTNYENTDVKGFAELMDDPDVVVLDVRTASEFKDGHLEGAMNIDQAQNDFIQKAQESLPADRMIAVYCRSGRRSTSAAERLAANGYQVVNLKGGILAWEEAQMPVTTDSYEVDVFKTQSGKTVKFHALVHASIRIEYDGREIEIDPVTKLAGRTIDYNAMPKADYIFVTHEHGDHFDKEALRLLTGDRTQLITNKRCAEMLGYGQVMANGDKMQIAEDFNAEAVPAYNISEGRTQFHPKGRDNGYILTIDGLRVYVAGDTEDIPEMVMVNDIDIAFMPCNQPYTMTTEQLVKAAKTVRPKVLFPYHYGQTDVSGIASQLKEYGIEVRIRQTFF